MFTFNKQPAGRRPISLAELTPVDTFIGFREVMDGHVTSSPVTNKESISKKTGREFGGGAVCFTLQSDIFPLLHWDGRA